MVSRRAFIGGITAALTTACTDASTNLDGSGANSEVQQTTTSLPPSVQSIEAPAANIAENPFTLGVASGDPDEQSVVLWTRLMGELPASIPVVWEITKAGDSEFSQLVATGLFTAASEDAMTVHAIATGLEPNETYWYRFKAGEFVSDRGITRTMPNDMSSVRIGVSSCQRRQDRHWQAHLDIAGADLDLMIWLGDYTYRTGETATDLEGLRGLYAEHKLDPLLQLAHASCPWFMGIDDNDVANDYTATSGAGNELRTAAYKAWWEHQPTRVPKPTGPNLATYRHIDIGQLARIVMFDNRQYSDPANQSMLGDTQLEWADEVMNGSHLWTIAASPVMVSELTPGTPDTLPYGWPAFDQDNQWLKSKLESASNALVLSGDLHTGLHATVTNDAGDQIATELMAPAISSSMPPDIEAMAGFLPFVNGNIHSVDPSQGWLKLEISSQETKATYRTTDATDANAPVEDGLVVTVAAA